MERLLELNGLAKKEAEKYSKKRSIYQRLVAGEGRAFSGLIGPRGVGKTVLLRQIARDRGDSFYISADTLGEADLFETAKVLAQRYGVRWLLLDEVHTAKGYAAALKKLYDFLDLHVVFTSSVALSLTAAAHDLSRRALLHRLWPFTFREFLSFAHGRELPVLSLADILERRWEPEHLRQGHLFDDYLKGGLFPFSLEQPDVKPILGGILEKVIRQDIPSVAGLRMDELGVIEKLLRFIGRSASDGISYSSVARNLGITKYKAEQYIGLLEKAFVLNPVLPIGTNVLREPKVLMSPPLRLLYRDLDDAIGGLREDFAAQAFKSAGLEFHYLKDPQGGKTPDFLVRAEGGDVVVEVGGKGKGRRQFKGYSAQKRLLLTPSDSLDGDRRPLPLLGFLG
ncbi:MAG: hypothetical protein A2X36_09050 [Elusimicrobia bacterium GWA2_69_24]|nr:MAG: hypothetical protein A2X36_09050 [Elusimicrobia bacterium GWA2_69_24]